MVRPAANAVTAPIPADVPVEVRTPEAVLIDVVVLSADLALFESVREAIGERNPVWRARSAEEAADLLITGRCGVLLMDLAVVSVRADTLIEQIVEQFPDVVVCVAGTREDEPLLAPLISDGLVYRFMHKPASPKRAGMFLQAAIRRHVERRDGVASGVTELLPILRTLRQAPSGWSRGYLIGAALLALALTVPVFMDGKPPERLLTPPPVATAPVASAPTLPHTSQRADPVLSRARAALQLGRLEAPQGRNALDLYEAVLLAQPGNTEARVGLDRTIEALLDHARSEAAAGRPAEAERLVQRVLAVEPECDDAIELAARLNPLDTPSLRLAREQVAAAQATATSSMSSASLTSSSRVTPSMIASSARPEPIGPVTRFEDLVPQKPEPVVIRPDPLAARFTNRPDGAPAATDSVSTVRVTPVGRHATAGYVTPTTATPPTATVAPPASPADALGRVYVRNPVYPAQALRDHTQGWVELEFTITESGAVRDIQVVQAQPVGIFDSAAADALAEWRFRPRVVNGRPVPQRSSVTLRFDVDG